MIQSLKKKTGRVMRSLRYIKRMQAGSMDPIHISGAKVKEREDFYDSIVQKFVQEMRACREAGSFEFPQNEIFSDYEFDSQNEAGYHFNAGSNYVDGEAALAFSRERYSFESGDRQRGRNQMAVIQAVVDKAVSTEMIRNYSSVLSGLTGCFGTNISYEEIARLLQKQLDSGKGWEIITYSVDGTGDQQAPYSYATGEIVYVMIPDYTTVEKAKSLMAKVRNSERITQEEADAGTSVNTD